MSNIYFIIIAVLCVIYVIYQVRKRKLSIKESFWWFFGSIITLILSIFPHIIDWIAIKLHISYPPSLLFVLCIIFLLFINLRDSKRMGENQEKIIELGQELSVLKDKVNSYNEKKK